MELSYNTIKNYLMRPFRRNKLTFCRFEKKTWERKPKDDLKSQAGFTLLELLVVIVILGLLIGFVAPAVLRQLGGARVSIAHQSIARLASVLDMYKLDVGSYPTTDQGLEALVHAPDGVANWNGPYVQSGNTPIDPWNHPYVYRDPSERAGHDFDLCSLGPDGTATSDAQICN